ncbi:MAG: ABC transporter permease, partial [Clostridia bacterium]|nr:ABC transporter permease [Clostridia bacterium]
MKKTQILEALRTIRKQKVSYISIVLIAFLAVTCFSGISFSAKGISESGSTYYDRQNFRDLEIVSAVMFTDSDLEAIRNLEGVKDAEGMLRTSGKLVAAGEKRTVSVLSPTERINLPQILEGAVPTKETEIAVEKELLAALKIKIGDTVSLEDTGAMKLLKNTEYTVVASFIHPDHLSTPNRFGDYVMVSKDAFDSTILSGRSLYAEIVVEKPEGINRFNDEYAEIISAYLRPLEELSVTCSKNSLESLWSQIAEYRNILRNDMVRPLLLSLIMIVKDCSPEEAEALLEKAQWAADELIPDLSKTDISARVIPILNDFSITLPDKENLVRSLVDQIRAHADKLSAFGIRLDAFSITDEMVDKMQETLNKFDLSLYDKLIAATDFWNEGHARYLKTVEHLLQSDSSDKEFTGVWVPFDARMNAAFTHMEMSVKGISTIAVRFTLLFVLVGAIVIYATVGKLVDEQKKLVGATKAFGFYNREVFGKYLIFGGSATLIGTVLGLLAGTFLLQLFIDYAYGRNYVSDFPDRTVIVWQIVVMVVAAVLLAFAAVLFASIKLIRSTAVSLMQGDVPTGMKKGKAGKKSRLSLYQRLILRNMKTDSKRVFVTVISIAGCCALMLIGFSVYMSVRETVRVQFEEVVRYDSSVHVEAAKAAEASEAVSGVLDGIGASSLPVYLESGAFRSGEAVDPAEFVVADPEKLSGYLNLYDAETGEPLKTDGLLIPYSYAATYSLKVGDSCVLMDKA